jgi:putative transcriptional regulator
MNGPLAPGALLIAAPSMTDPNFAGTVVLLCIHEEEGSIGLVLNRPLAVRAAEALPSEQQALAGAGALHWGGPVAASQLFLLHEAPVSPEEGRCVIEGIHFGGGLEAARRIADCGGRLRCFTGYAGWGEEQLAAELADGDWLTLAPDAAEVWTDRSQWQWERLAARADPALSWMNEAARPDAN